MEVILLTGKVGAGKYALIDDEDFDRVSRYTWRCHRRGYCYYPVSTINGELVYMHRFLMNPLDDMVVDHMNGNGLDNRKSNMRICTHSTNSLNRIRANKNNTSGQRGVSWRRDTKTWQVLFRKNGRLHFFGTYTNKQEAVEVARIANAELFNSQNV